eukprot:TRINITY_DN63413_c0_g1_i1.p1 TRINITY_DN63413_c0_g1~~TRINITY_DN63413_c0_g1_i1.p1  ORF type:complete len:328 (-),score=46.15 TRINITY_DN63413_c0_g1_i1:66-1049(-)
MRGAVHQHAQEAAHRVLQFSMADAANRATTGRHRSLPVGERWPSRAISDAGIPARAHTPPNRLQTPGSVVSSVDGRSGVSPMHGAGSSLVLSRTSTPAMRRPSRSILERSSSIRTQDADAGGRPEPSPTSGGSGGSVAPSIRADVLDVEEEAAASIVAAATAAVLRPQSPPPRAPSSHVSVTDGGASEADKETKQRQKLPDRLDFWILREEMRKLSTALARNTASPEAIDGLDLPGLAALRAELVASHTQALERIDDRRVTLQAQQAATQEGPERGRCIACWAKKADRVLLPCRHLCLCGSCLVACNSQCPICRGVVADSLEVFGVT